MSDIATFFKVDPVSVQKFFSPDDIGYYIPPYQRAYSWDEGHVKQLLADVCYGVEASLKNPKSLHFLGTVILTETKEGDSDISKLDQKALPDQIRKIIDGQQRISTLSLLACLLYQRLHTLKQALPAQGLSGSSDYLDLAIAVTGWQKILQEVFSYDLKRGKPERKPIVIRGRDTWVEKDQGQSTYKSEVSSFLADFIRSIDDNPADPCFPAIPAGEPVGSNLRTIDSVLEEVATVHLPNSGDNFPPAWHILGSNIPESQLWNYPRPQLVALITNRSNPLTQTESQVCAIVQLLAFCYYLLRRCGFTVIVPTSDEGAFDMFQSLNATGTPLTAIETFKPLVVQSPEINGGSYQNSTSEAHFEHVDNMFKGATTAAAKNTLTNAYLTTFAIVHNGTKLASQFSAQRMWLTQQYSACNTPAKQEEFVRRMGDLARYWDQVLGFDPKTKNHNVLPNTEKVTPYELAQEAALCVLYLKEAGHTMAHTILSRFYAQILRNKAGADQDFVLACRTVAAFFTLWRAALPNKDLDDVYRDLLRNHMSWEKGDTHLTISELKQYLNGKLQKKGIGTKNDWKLKARKDLRYDTAKAVCRFALFVAAHDTEPDSATPGLMRIATTGTDPHLTPQDWRHSDFKSIEHVAPQTRDTGATWDEEIYVNVDQQRIGNLILLPTDINSVAGNKRWIEKWWYYQHLAQTDPVQLQNLTNLAAQNNINMAAKTVKKLRDAGHHSHIRSVVSIGQQGKWDRQLITQRTERICDILWDRLSLWLN